MTTENNKIIAEFMEWHYMGINTYLTPYSDAWSTNGKQTYSCPLNVMRFHSDWNWLMEVVEKIEILKSEVVIQGSSFGTICNIRHFKGVTDVEFKFQGHSKVSKIEAIYNACLEFIKWYNEQNRK